MDTTIENMINSIDLSAPVPEIVRAQYFEALENVKKAEAKMKSLLIEGGYVDEQ